MAVLPTKLVKETAHNFHRRRGPRNTWVLRTFRPAIFHSFKCNVNVQNSSIITIILLLTLFNGIINFLVILTILRFYIFLVIVTILRFIYFFLVLTTILSFIYISLVIGTL